MIYLLISNVLTLLAFILGIKIGIKVRKEEKIEVIPNIPKIIKEEKRQAEVEKVVNEIQTIARNVENYNGSGEGQVDIR